MADEDEFAQLGGEEYFCIPNLVLIEWAERIERALPAERLDISIESLSQQTRRFELAAAGERYQQVVKQVHETLGDIHQAKH
jgi:tRNA threonylcarbamoyladenosine biosynthesis protein TsaE